MGTAADFAQEANPIPPNHVGRQCSIPSPDAVSAEWAALLQYLLELIYLVERPHTSDGRVAEVSLL